MKTSLSLGGGHLGSVDHSSTCTICSGKSIYEDMAVAVAGTGTGTTRDMDKDKDMAGEDMDKDKDMAGEDLSPAVTAKASNRSSSFIT